MRFSLLPKCIMDSPLALTASLLQSWGIRLLMLDFDNTIIPYTTDIPSAAMEAWLQEMAASQVQVCIVSNSHNDRVKRFCAQRGLACITHARKPFSKGINQCLKKYGIKPEQAVLVGDQIFTDVLGANCAGVRSVLVKPINNHNIWLKLRHLAEKPFIYAARNRRMKQ